MRQRGFSLIEILIVVGLMGIVALGTATLVSNMTKANKGIQFGAEVIALTNEIRGTISTVQSCSLNFGPTRPGGALDPNATTAIAQLFASGAPTPAYDTAPGVFYGNRTVHIDSIEFGAPNTYLGPNPSVSPFQVRMRVKLSTPKEVIGVANVVRDIQVFVRTNAAGTVESCSTGALSPFIAENLNTNGYVMFPNGLIMQWGQATARRNGFTTIPFTIPFPNRAFSVVVTGTVDSGADDQDNWPSLYNNTMTRTDFVVISSDDQDDPVSWIAYGN